MPEKSVTLEILYLVASEFECFDIAKACVEGTECVEVVVREVKMCQCAQVLQLLDVLQLVITQVHIFHPRHQFLWHDIKLTFKGHSLQNMAYFLISPTFALAL